MNYVEYLRIQTEVHGQIDKPPEYHVAERLAIDFLFKDIPQEAIILDVGCAVGLGMQYLKQIGYKNVTGIDINHRKVAVAREAGHDAYVGDVAHVQWQSWAPPFFDVIYCSHTFEHMYDPEQAITGLLRRVVSEATFFFILPYVDTGDLQAHCASEELGLRVRDMGDTVIKWFEDRGLRLVSKSLSDEREPEIWLEFRRLR
jgi:SAM-dependent methyltransferase